MTSLLRGRTRADRTHTRRQVRSNVGREDRLVRGCIALSLLLLGGFALLLSGQLGIISMLFVLLLGYFAGTAAVGWDPLYARTGIDTRGHRELALADDRAWAAQPQQAWGDDGSWAAPVGAPLVLDLTDGARASTSAADGEPAPGRPA